MTTPSFYLPKRAVACCVALATFLSLPAAQSAVLIDMSASSADFNGDVAGSTAGPYTDGATGVSGTITTVQVTNTAGVAGSSLVFAGSQSGIDNIGISLQESWTFEWNTNSQLLQIDFSAMGTGLVAAIQSDAWIGASITPGSVNVSFDSLTGTFQFNGDQAGDGFSTANMYGVSAIPVISAGTDIRLFSSSGGGFSIGQGFTWNLLAVPEPSTYALLLGGTGFLYFLRRRRV